MKKTQELQKKYPLQLGADNNILRKECQDVGPITKKTREFHKHLLELMRSYEGVGLAAPQIGVDLRMAAVTQRDMSQKKRQLLQELVLINPRILAQSEQTVIEEEACLSLPGITGHVERATDITVQYLDISGKTKIIKASGYNARIILHEMDHLDGVLFIDKLST